MHCAACGHGNRPGAKFCEDCAAPLPRACARCGRELRPGARYCDECGAPVGAGAGRADALAPLAEAPGARKVVTIVFADLVGSTSLHERLDAEAVRRFMEAYYAAMRGAVEAHGGVVTQLLGDGVKAVFGARQVAEDDAIRAVRAAAAMQRAFRALAETEHGRVGKTGLRVAVNTGEVVADGASEIIGDPVNVAARLQEQGRDGDVVVGGETQRVVATQATLELLGSFALKGRSEAVKAYRLVSLERPTGVATAAFVGRDEELSRLRAVYDTAASKPAAALCVVLGSPGLGKSRLIDEFARRLGGSATVLFAHCDAAGGGTFAPLVPALRQRFGIESDASPEALAAAVEAALPRAEPEHARIVAGVSALLSGSPALPEETFFVVRRLLSALAREKPVVLAIDDLHWAESLLLDLVEHLVQWGSSVPLFVLVGARPELREQRSSLVTPGGLVADVLTLAGLDAGAAMQLAAGVIGAADLPAALAAKLLATSEGNPLFVGELVKMLVAEGVLERQGERWVASAALADLDMPPTIHALLAARIERLRPEERAVLERAAVIGRRFSRGAVAALLAEPRDLDARLESLRRSELIERDSGWFLGEPALRFHHVLIRDAAYRRVLKATRAELHRRLADWIEAKVGDVSEHDETLGWHLEQAQQHLREIGPLDARGLVLGERAARRLATAGRRALTRDDVALAASLLGRALACLPEGAAERADLALDSCEALLAVGDVGPAVAAIEELARFTADSDRLRAWHTCFAGQLAVLTAPSALRATVDGVAAAAEELAALGDAAGAAKAHYVHALALSRLGKIGACESALDRALASARRAGDNRRSNTVLAIAPLAALWGPSAVTRASGRCLDVVRVLRITQGAPAVEAVALSCQGVLEALRGRTDAARRMTASARKLVEELGITQRLLEVDVFAGLIEQLEGNAPAAERVLRDAYEGLRQLGLGIAAARAAALLARSLLAQGRDGEAEALSQESEALAGDDLKAAIAWRGVRAEALARRGEHLAAVEYASRAVELAAATDALLDHADARLALAAALRAAGRGGDADAEERRAIELWGAKGATLLVERAGRESRSPVPAEPRPERATTARRRVRANAATRTVERERVANRSRDEAQFARVYGESVEVLHHPTGARYGAAELRRWIRAMWRAKSPEIEVEALATLGDSLALVRRAVAHQGADTKAGSFGPMQVEYACVLEVDEGGLARREEVFAAARLDHAIERLYERYAELAPEGAERERAAGFSRTVAAMLAAPDLERIAPVLAPDIEMLDHRVLGTWFARDANGVLQHFRSLAEVAAGVLLHGCQVLDARPDALLVLRTHSGNERVGGGGYERRASLLLVAGADGRLARLEWFDADRGAEALARFDALTSLAARKTLARLDGQAPSREAEPPFANAASRAESAQVRCFNGRDWEGVRDGLAPEVVFDDRRRMNRAETDRDGFLAQFRFVFDVPTARFASRLVATRGERLSLHLSAFHGEVAGGGGPLELAPHLALHEVDREGRIVAIVLFDLPDEDAAYAELDARFAAGEATEHPAASAWVAAFRRAFARRDWDAFAALHGADQVAYNHRIVGWGTLRGPGAWIPPLQELVELAPDVRQRVEHVRTCACGALWHYTWIGTRDGGPFESPMWLVVELDEQGLERRVDVFESSAIDAALGRFGEIAAQTRARPVHFANAATRAAERGGAAIGRRDWAGFGALFAHDLRHIDRRALVQLDTDRESFLRSHREIIEMTSARPFPNVLATRGERLALVRILWQGTEGDVGPSEIEWLLLIEANALGEHRLVVAFEPGDLDGAYAELDARYAAGEGAAHAAAVSAMEGFQRAVEQRDWEAVAGLCAEGFVEHDHRALAVLGTSRGAEAWARNFRALAELSADALYRVDHFRTSARGFLSHGGWHGTREGGAYELPLHAVIELDARGLVARADIYDDGGVEAALARFEEIAASAPRDPLAPIAKPTAATAALDRWWAALDVGAATDDWQPLRSICDPLFAFEDRQRFSQVAGDLEHAIESLRARVAFGARIEGSLLGTAGDRVAIARAFWSGGPADAPFEFEYFAVLEVAESGSICAITLFDEARAAQREAWARWAKHDPATVDVTGLLGTLIDAFDAKDRARWRAALADDLVVEDHRRTGTGRIEGADAYADTVFVLWDLVEESEFHCGWLWPAFGRHGALSVARRTGTLRDGGVFESDYLQLLTVAGGRVTRAEMWELDALEQALARFEELRPDALDAAT